jgi:carboxylesterase
VLVHGFGATPDELRPLGEHLATAGHPAHGVLLPGHGTTIAEFGAFGADAWRREVEAAVDALRADGRDVALIGMSMGALLALVATAARPETIRALVLCGAALELHDRRARWIGALGRLPILARLVPALPKPGGRDISDPAARAASPTYDRLPLGAIGELTALQAEAADLLGQIMHPTLVLHGRHDHAVPVRVVERLRSALAATWVETHVLERSWHVVTLDVDRQEVAERTTDFLARVEATLAG